MDTTNYTPLAAGTRQVRDALEADAEAMARALVGAWRAAYPGILDADFLARMDVARIAASWAKSLAADAGARPLVAVLDGEVVGFCQFGEPRDDAETHTGELYALNLLPSCWGRGLGTALMFEALDALHRSGYTQVYLWVAAGNRRAMDLYERHGWRDTGVTKSDARFTPALFEHRYAIELGTAK